MKPHRCLMWLTSVPVAIILLFFELDVLGGNLILSPPLHEFYTGKPFHSDHSEDFPQSLSF